jgi:hypothetical protein
VNLWDKTEFVPRLTQFVNGSNCPCMVYVARLGDAQ